MTLPNILFLIFFILYIYSKAQDSLIFNNCDKPKITDTIMYLPFLNEIYIPDGVDYSVKGELPSAIFKFNNGYLRVNVVWNTFPDDLYFKSLLEDSLPFNKVIIYNKDLYYLSNDNKVIIYFMVENDYNSDNRWMFKISGIINESNICEFTYLLKEYIKKRLTK